MGQYTDKIFFSGITGYLKTEFRVFKRTPSGDHAYGIIADDIYRLCAQIDDFQLDDELVQGVHVKMVGHIDRSKPGAPIVKIHHMGDVYVNKDHPPLDAARLKLAFNSPLESESTLFHLGKRSCAQRDDNDDEKKVRQIHFPSVSEN